MKIKFKDKQFNIDVSFIESPYFFSAKDIELLKTLYKDHVFYKGMEIKDNLDIENEGSSKKVVESILKGTKPENDNEQLVANLDTIYRFTYHKNEIDTSNIRLIYDIMWSSLKNQENKLESKEVLWRSKPGEISICNKKSFTTLDPDYLDGVMEELIKFINSKKLENNNRLKSIIIMFWFVYAHPYYDFNGKMSRIISGWYLKIRERYLESMLFSLVFKVQRSSFLDSINKIRDWESKGKTKSLNITETIKTWYSWLMTARVAMISFVEIKLNNGVQKSDNKIAIYVSIYLKSEFSKQKEFTAKDIETMLNLQYTNQNLYKTLDQMVKEGFLKKRKQTKTPVYSAIKKRPSWSLFFI